MAAAPGFSPLLGGALDHIFGWRSEFAFVGAFAAIAAIGYGAVLGETHHSTRIPLNPLAIAKTYFGLVADCRFLVPAATVSLIMGGLFAMFSAAPRILIEGLHFSPIQLGLFFAGTVMIVFGAGMLATKLAPRFGFDRSIRGGLLTAAVGNQQHGGPFRCRSRTRFDFRVSHSLNIQNQLGDPASIIAPDAQVVVSRSLDLMIQEVPLAVDWPLVERLQHEFAAIGFYLSSHPLDPYGKSLERAGIIRYADLPVGLAANAASRFKLAGIVIGRKERTSGRGNRFAFVQMSDPSGTFEVTLFSEILSESRALVDSGQPLVATVDVRSEEDSLRLTAQKIEPLDTVVAHAAAGLRVFLGEARALANLKSVIAREAGGRGRVTVVLDLPSREVEIALPGGFKVDPRTRAAVKSLPGIVDVHDI